MIVFMLLFHKEESLKATFERVRPDRISVLYLQLLMDMDPDDASLRLDLARQLVRIDDMDKAYLVLKPLLGQQGREATEARLLSLELDMKMYFSMAATDPAKAKALADLGKKISAFVDESVPVDLLPKVIQHSLEFGQPLTAAKLYERWAGADNAHRFDHLKAAGRWYMAAGLPLSAAEVYDKAYAAAGNDEQARQSALLAIDALQAADKAPLALTLIKNSLQRLKNDKALLDKAIALSLAIDDPKQALAWGNLRLSLTPDDPEQISRQMDLALAAGAPDAALPLAERLSALQPKDRHVHERTAQIAEWAGKPDLALNQWIWLARQDKKDEAAIENALRLAKGLYAGETIIEMLTARSEKRALTGDDLNSLIEAFNNVDNSAHLASFLRGYLIKYPNEREAWKALAKAQEDAGQVLEAIATWQHVAVRFGQPVQAAVQQSQLLWRAGESEKALALLLRNRERAAPKDAEFWQLLADLSWELEQTDNALLAYKTLWKTEAADELAAERLIQLLKEDSQAQEAIAVARQAYRRFSQPRWLLLAMDTAVDFQLWKELGKLLQTADADKRQFEPLEMYWLKRAQLHGHDHQMQQVLADYQQALKANPASIVAKEGVLWALIEQRDKQNLANFLQLWQQDAMTTPSLWGVYGLGLSQLGRDEQALAWFERSVKLNQDNYLWLLTYADTLAKAGHADAALDLRQHVLFKLRAKLRQSNDPADSASLLQPAYLALVRELDGADFEEMTLQKLAAKGMDDPVVRELAVASYLSQENFDAARFWLLRAHAARQQTPVWQRLTLALADNDKATAADILSKEGDKLTLLDRVEPLKRLDRADEALALLDNYLQTSDDIGIDQPELYRYRDELALQQSARLDLAWDIKSLGVLDINQSQARFTLPLSEKALAFQFRHNYLHTGSSELALPAHDEFDLSLEGNYVFQSGDLLQLNIGGNLQNQESLVYGSIGLTSRLADFLQANVRVGLHELSTETAQLRALGAKDKVSLILSGELTRQSFFQLDIDGHRYLTRQGSVFAEGYRINSILGYTLLKAMPAWQVRLQGSWESNSLEDNLPPELRSSLLSPFANVETMISQDYATMGVGTTFRYGLSEQDIPRQPYLLVDAWIGWAWPSNEVAYNARLGAGISLFKADVLSISAFYGNVQGGKADEAYEGVGVQYSIRF